MTRLFLENIPIRKTTTDYTGKKIGKLSVVRFLGYKGTRYRATWLCKCECGNEVEVTTRRLTRPRSPRCIKCSKELLSLPRPNQKTNAPLVLVPLGKGEDLSNKRFGRLTVSKYLGKTHDKKTQVWECLCDCGNTTNVRSGNLRNGHAKSCGCYKKEVSSKSKKGHKHFNYKNGRIKVGEGYIRVLSREHPNADHHGYVLEHRLVMEQYLGRLLTKQENVHHKNGDKEDNRIENLELWSRSQPCGQRVIDKIKWAKEILSTYGSDETKYGG